MAGLLKKIVKGALIGGGTILSLLSPPVGGAIVTAGMAIGSGAVAAGGLIKTNMPSIDKVTTDATRALESKGLLKPALTPLRSGTAAPTFVLSTPILIGAALVLALLIFKKR